MQSDSPLTDFPCSGWSAISPGEKHIVVSNLFDGLDFYCIADRALSHSVPYPMNQQNNVPVPVLFSSDGNIVIVGGVSGSARILDSGSCETLQVLPHDGQFFRSPFPPHHQLITPTGDTIQAIVRLSNQPVFLAHAYQDSCVTQDGIRIIAAGVSERDSETTIRVWTPQPTLEPQVPPSRFHGHDRKPPLNDVIAPTFFASSLTDF